MEYSPGDLLDKLSIIQIKFVKGLPVQEELFHLQHEAKPLLDHPEINLCFIALLSSNEEQYNLEDKVRVEQDLAKVGAIALDIREHNDNRVKLKNEINRLAGYHFMEEKLYMRTEKIG